MSNYYQLLGVPYNAVHDEINTAFKKQAKIYHPDKKGNTPEATAFFQLLNRAKEILLDPKIRLQYDYYLGIRRRPQPRPIYDIVRVNNRLYAVVGGRYYPIRIAQRRYPRRRF